MRFLREENIPLLLHRLSESATVWAPQVVRDTVNTVLFSPWLEGAEVETGLYSMLSAKELVLPATERLFSYRYSQAGGREKIEINADAPQEQAAIFAARACDAKGLAVMDALFLDRSGASYNDGQYRARRSGLTVITLACTTCDSACFCSSFEKGAAETAGSDIILYPATGGYLAEAVSKRGEELAALDLFRDSSLEKPELARTAKVELAGLGQRLFDIYDDLDFWRRTAEGCLSCGYCSYACPACHCFNIFDEAESDRTGGRFRCWDACMFYAYTQESSGNNPRPEPAHRYRNRLAHKFSYYPLNRGEILCTGCGRCIRGCPAGLDLRDAIRAVRAR